MRLRVLAVTALAALLAATLSACGDDSGESDRFITVYNAQHEELLDELAPKFTKETGIEVKLRNGKDFELGNQLVEEGDRTPADVFLTENSPAMSLVESKGLFAPLDQTTLDRIPEQYRPASGDWTGFVARSTVLVYDKDAVKRGRPARLDPRPRQAGVEGTHVVQPLGRGLPGHRQRRPAAEGREGHRAVARGHRRERHGLPGQQRGDELRQRRPGRHRDHLPLLLVPRPEGSRREQQQLGAALLRQGGPGRVPQRLRRRRAQGQQEAEGRPALRRLPHRASSGQQALADSYALEYPLNPEVELEPPVKPLSELEPPKVDVSDLNGPKVIAHDAEGRTALSTVTLRRSTARHGHERRPAGASRRRGAGGGLHAAAVRARRFYAVRRRPRRRARAADPAADRLAARQHRDARDRRRRPQRRHRDGLRLARRAHRRADAAACGAACSSPRSPSRRSSTATPGCRSPTPSRASPERC